MEKLLPIGTPVFDLINGGWTKIKHHDTNPGRDYRYLSENGIWYTIDGKETFEHTHPVLSLTSYSLQDGQFTSILEFDFNIVKIGDFGYFWDDEERKALIYSKLILLDNSSKSRFHNLAGISFKNFSKEIPEFFKIK